MKRSLLPSLLYQQRMPLREQLVRAYYFFPTYVLLAIVIYIGATISGQIIGRHARSGAGLPPYDPQDFDTIGISMVTSLACIIILAYFVVGKLIIVFAHPKPKTAQWIYHIAVIFLFLFGVLIGFMWYHLITDAPVDGYPKWQF